MTRRWRVAACVGAGAGLVLLQACASPERSFQEAKARDTEEAYTEFLVQFPDHPLAAEAKLKMEQLDWRAASEAGTVDAVRGFFRLHPEPALDTLGGAVELAPGLVVSEIETQRLDKYTPHGLPAESRFEKWVTGGRLSMSVAAFGGKDPSATAPDLLQAALWLENRSEEEQEVWFSDEDGATFAAPLVVGDSEPVSFTAMDIPGSSIADVSLLTKVEGRLGVCLGKGERTWLVLLYSVPDEPRVGVLLLGSAPVPVRLSGPA
jgi:hypothetical protein